MRGTRTALALVAAVMLLGMTALAQHQRMSRDQSGLFAGQISVARSVTITVDGKPLSTPTPPLMVNGRVMLPMRAVFQELGATVKWEPMHQQATATKGDRRIALRIDNRSATVDGRTVLLDAAPLMYRDVVYVPVRAVSESLGAQVSWQADRRQVAMVTRPPQVAAVPRALTGTTIIANGRTVTTGAIPVAVGTELMVPAVPVFTQLYAQPTWDAQQQQLSACICGRQVTLKAGDPNAMVGGQAQPLSHAPFMYQGQLYVPLDFVTSAFNASGGYEAAQSQVVLSTRGCPVG
jgi:hypothetical protein